MQVELPTSLADYFEFIPEPALSGIIIEMLQESMQRRLEPKVENSEVLAEQIAEHLTKLIDFSKIQVAAPVVNTSVNSQEVLPEQEPPVVVEDENESVTMSFDDLDDDDDDLGDLFDLLK